MGDSLEIAFRKHRDVSVDSAPSFRKYMKWGSVGLMWTHGHMSKKKGEFLPQVFATESRAIWGETLYNEIHLGHYHEESSKELYGCTVRVLPSLSGTDAWHSEHEYVGNLKRSMGLLWAQREGLVGTTYYNVREEKGAVKPA
jgi:hypothetical protein